MRNILFLLVVAACSKPIPPAIQTPDPTTVMAVPVPVQKSEPPAEYSKLMGFQLDPADRLIADVSWETTTIGKGFDDEKIECKEKEFRALKTPVPFRDINAGALALVTDAQKIGWELKARKQWHDAVLYDATWHSEHRALFILFNPGRLSIGICALPKTPTAAQVAARPVQRG